MKNEKLIGYLLVGALIIGLGVSAYYLSYAVIYGIELPEWHEPEEVTIYHYGNGTEIIEHNITKIVLMSNTDVGSLRVYWTEYNMTGLIWKIKVLTTDVHPEYDLYYQFENNSLLLELAAEYASFSVYFSRKYNLTWEIISESNLGSVEIQGDNVNITDLSVSVDLGSFNAQFEKVNITNLSVNADMGSITTVMSSSILENLSLKSDAGSISLTLNEMILPKTAVLKTNAGSISVAYNNVEVIPDSNHEISSKSGSVSFRIDLLQNNTCLVNASTDTGSISTTLSGFVTMFSSDDAVIVQTPDYVTGNGLYVRISTTRGSISIDAKRQGG